MFPFVLALASAAMYGSADFLGGLASKRASTLAVVVGSQLAGLVLLAALLPLLPGSAPQRPDFMWGAIAGLSGGAGVAFLYRALAIGTMAVVAPTTAVCAVALPVAVSLVLGERPPLLTFAGIGLAVVAIVLVGQQATLPDHGQLATLPDHGQQAIPSGHDRPADRRAGRLDPGLGLALLAGIAIGIFFLSLARTGTNAGLWPLVAARAVSVTLFVGAAAAGGQSLALPRDVRMTALLCGVLDMGANALYMLAARAGPLSIVVTLSSLYPASTVLLARLVLGERLNGRQILGVVCALAAVVLIVSSV